MNGLKIRQCIFNVVGVFFLITGIIDFLSISYSTISILVLNKTLLKRDYIWMSISPRLLPSLAVIVISIFLISIAKKVLKFGSGQSCIICEENKVHQRIKAIEGSAIGLLLIIDSGYHFLTNICNQLSSLISLRSALLSGETNLDIKKQAVDTVLMNIPSMLLYAAGIVIGIWFIIRAKKKYGSDTKAKDSTI